MASEGETRVNDNPQTFLLIFFSHRSKYHRRFSSGGRQCGWGKERGVRMAVHSWLMVLQRCRDWGGREVEQLTIHLMALIFLQIPGVLKLVNV